MGTLIPRASIDRYPHELSASFRAGQRIYDPDWSLSQDEEIYEKTSRDAVVAHAMQMRRHMVAGRDWQVLPGAADDASRQLAAVVEDLLGDLPLVSARFALAAAVFRGAAYAQMYGHRVLRRAAGALANWWVPTSLVDIDKRRVRRVTTEAGMRPEIWDVTASQWVPIEHPELMVVHIYGEDESSLGCGRGLMQAIYFYFRAKAVAMQQGLQGLERWAQGQTVWAVDAQRELSGGRTLAQVYEEYLSSYEKMRAKHVYVHDAADKMELVDGPSEGHQIVRDMIEYCDSRLLVLILGSNLPTQATAGGSYALAEVQEASTETLIAYDRSLLDDTLTRDLVGEVLRLNAPQLAAAGLADARAPRFQTLLDRRQDPAQAASVIVQALAAGIPLKRHEVYEAIGFTPPCPGDDVIERAAQVPAAQAGATS